VVKDGKYETLLRRVGSNIEKHRKAKGMSQKEVAYACNMEEQNYRRIEKSQTNPTLKSLCRIAEVFGIEVSDLLQ